jgi:hypothetical protein
LIRAGSCEKVPAKNCFNPRLVDAGDYLAKPARTIWRRYHTLALDPRGQGESQVPIDGFTASGALPTSKNFLNPFRMFC